ncbi:MAG: iron-containing alcohol dehydrogenase, partial [Lachnospiraceae bacterium]|nr:iron-containing alcohol dehydrogenase [Lachnospiraceae bacterium]
RIQLVREGVDLCRRNKVDMVLAIGGGSSIDCAKLVAAGVCYQGDASDYLKPRMAILDPTYMFTVPASRTAAGAVDIMSHVFESYFTNTKGAVVQGHLCEAILKTVIQYAPIACTRQFFARLGMPATLHEIGIDETHFEDMARSCCPFCEGCYVPLTMGDIIAIYKKAL